MLHSPNLMGDHGTMARARTPESRRGPSGCQRDCVPRIVGDERDGRVDEGPGAAQEALRRWRNRSDAAVVEESKQSARDTMAELKQLRAENAELRRVNEIPATASAFSRYGYIRMHPADCAGLGFPEGRPRPGDANHARTRHTRHQEWQDARHHQVSPGNRR